MTTSPPDDSKARPKLHDPGSSRFWWIPGGMLVAAAAAIIMWWVWPPSEDILELDDLAPRDAPREPLPSFVLETDGGLEQLRGEAQAAGRHRYRRDTSFEWNLRPAAHVDEDIAVRGFAFVDGGRAGLPLHLEQLTSTADDGAIRIAGEIARLDLEPGRYTIALIVGRPDELPVQAAEVVEPSEAATALVRRIDITIDE